MIAACCEKCGEVFEVPDSLGGRFEHCPKCGALAEIPEAPVVVEGIGREGPIATRESNAVGEVRLKLLYREQKNPSTGGIAFCVILGLVSLLGAAALGSEKEYAGGIVLAVSGIGWFVVASLFSMVGRIVLALERLAPPPTESDK